ncbi:MAG: hypothetical protein HY553_18695 [Elusimicrobia bacterium]|nr:hypothetical protein [Elusimicrobiota bacterium]
MSLVLLLAGLLAAAAHAERVASEDGKFSVEFGAPWSVDNSVRDRAVWLDAKEKQSLVIVGEWRDGAAPVPPQAHQAAVKGAETATSPRPGRHGVRYARRPSERLQHLQGWLSCGGDRYLFDARVLKEKLAWSVVDSLECRPAPEARGLDIGTTGWRVSIPPGFRQIGDSTDGRGLWKRERDVAMRDPQGRPATVRVEDSLWVMAGTETWSKVRPWPGTCKFANRHGVAVEPPVSRDHGGKTAFRYACGSSQEGARQVSLAYDLVFDYDAALGVASFVTMRFDIGPGRGAVWWPEEMIPDAATFAEVTQSLALSRPAPTGGAPHASGGAVPLLR